jgi:hypothetical protein
MHKPLHLFTASLFVLFTQAQKTDTLLLFYKTDQFKISKQDKQKLDSFILRGWDRIAINGHTDEIDDDEYNIELSGKRSGEVYRYFLEKKIDSNYLSSQYFGELMPRADNSTEEGRALNRRTEIIGYQFARLSLQPKTDWMKPVTKTLDNGFIITYRPGYLPDYLLANFNEGSGINFLQINNTAEMRQNRLFNNTTSGEILSSVLIICGNQLNPCNLDSPLLIKVPIPYKIKCPVTKVKFFNAVAENGRSIWQEETRLLYPEMIDGRQYVGVWMNNFCNCINFDFKIDPECFDTDSTQVFYVNGTIKNLSAELKGLNSVYLPRKLNDSTHSILYLKDKSDGAALSFGLYMGKRRIRSFKDQPITSFPYDETSRQYLLITGNQKFYFPRLKVWDVVLKVNGDRYRVAEEKNRFSFIYLNRKTETILVDFSIMESKNRITQYKNLPLDSFPYDEKTGYRVIDRKFLKTLKEKTAIVAK